MSKSSGSNNGNRELEKKVEVRGIVSRERDTEEIASKSFMIETKRYYLDLKENNRGRFVRLTQVDLNGRKNRLFMSMLVCKNLKQVLDNIEKEGYTAEKPKPKEGIETKDNGNIYTETIANDQNRYYIDLRENQRGVFLRVTQFEVQTGNRNSVLLSLQGLGQFNDALEELIDEFGEGYIDIDEGFPKLQSFRMGGKNFYFGPCRNNRGDFLKITEFKPSMGIRNTIALSVKAIPQFVQVLNKLHEDFQSIRAVDGAENSVEKATPPIKKSPSDKESKKAATKESIKNVENSPKAKNSANSPKTKNGGNSPKAKKVEEEAKAETQKA